MWPEHVPAFRLFSAMRTQWRIGMNGRTGLDYPTLFAMMSRLPLSGEEWDDLFDDVRVMEAEALEVMNK